MKVENLVLEGNGAVGVAYVGALKALEENNISQNFKRVCGTSSGSIMALLVALKLSSEEISSAYNNLKFKKILDGDIWSPFRFLFKFGWCKGDYLESYCRDLVKSKTGLEHATFKDFSEHKDLCSISVIVANLSKATSMTFSVENTPDFEVVKAIRMSFSIPFAFASKKYNGNLMVDGGMIRVYGIDYYDKHHKDCKPNETLGLYLDQQKTFSWSTPTNIFAFIKSLVLLIVVYQQYDELRRSKKNMDRTIFIDSLGISPFKFNLTDSDKKNLTDQGYKDTVEYINNHVS